MSTETYPWKNKISEDPCCEPLPLFKIENLNIAYDDKTVVENLNLIINEKCINGIIGPSGCGKSSFLQSLNRMLEVYPNANTAGNILYREKSIFDSKTDLRDLRKKIGIIFQEPTPLPLSIIENITLALKEHGFDDIKERAIQALKDVGLFSEVCDMLHHSASQLSGGQKQRLCIARTIALNPEVILMDEPCSSLDPISTDKIEQLISELKSKFTIVIVTHNLAQARRICDHLFVFWFHGNSQAGYLLESGNCHDVFEKCENPLVQDYLGGLKG